MVDTDFQVATPVHIGRFDMRQVFLRLAFRHHHQVAVGKCQGASGKDMASATHPPFDRLSALGMDGTHTGCRGSSHMIHGPKSRVGRHPAGHLEVFLATHLPRTQTSFGTAFAHFDKRFRELALLHQIEPRGVFVHRKLLEQQGERKGDGLVVLGETALHGTTHGGDHAYTHLVATTEDGRDKYHEKEDMKSQGDLRTLLPMIHIVDDHQADDGHEINEEEVENPRGGHA